jgi:hypothetical protein
LVERLQPVLDPSGDEVKQRLKAASEQAIAAGVFGVPTLAFEGKLFWGLDALPMLRDHLLGGAWFQGTAWNDAANLPVGVQRT